MNDIAKQTPDISGRLHEFSFDVLARIVPGIVVVASYFASVLKDLDASLLIGVGVVVAYVVGYGIEMTTLLFDKCLVSPILRRIESWLSPGEKEYRDGQSLLPLTELQMWSYEDRSGKKARFFKMLAERSMWRSLVFVSIFYCCKPPQFFNTVSTQLGIDSDLLPWSILAVSLLGFYFLSYFVSSHVRWRI